MFEQKHANKTKSDPVAWNNGKLWIQVSLECSILHSVECHAFFFEPLRYNFS